MRAGLGALLLVTGCLDTIVPLKPPRADLAPPAPSAPVDAGTVAADLGASPKPKDLAEPADLTSDPGDLAGGLVPCWGVAVCDPTSTLCIKYISGSPGIPGPPLGAPACFATFEACAVPSCGCIQADPVLSNHCAVCFDNQNGSFTCYG